MTGPTHALDLTLELTVLLAADMRAGLAELGLSESGAHALHLIGTSGPVTQRVLVDALDLAPRTVTGLVDRLVGSGHVVRAPHPTDRRAVLVTPTAHGQEVADALVAGRTTLADRLFGDLDERALAELVGGLEVTLARLRTLLARERS